MVVVHVAEERMGHIRWTTTGLQQAVLGARAMIHDDYVVSDLD